MKIKNLLAWVIIFTLTLAFLPIYPAFGVDYESEVAINKVDGHIWQNMSYEEQKAYVLGFYGGQLSMFGEMADDWGIKSISLIPETTKWLSRYYERTGNINKTVAEVISIHRESNGTPEETQSKQSDRVVAKYSGSGMKTTRPFTVDSSWEIQWKASGMIFQVYLQSEDGQMVDILANQQGEGEGSSYNPKAGTYYLEINAMGEWEVKIVEVE